jgi:hypothetical protein
MRFYNQPHEFYCGVDLHARSMYLCILDHAGNSVLHEDLPAEPAAFLEAIAPYRNGLVVACECLFCWYWLADLCHAENLFFVLGHALYAENSIMQCACLRTAGCPFAERKVLTTPTGGASSNFAPKGVESPLAQPRQPGRADTLKRRRKVRDEILGRDGKPLQSPSRKGRRQTLNRCLVQPARGVDASLQKHSLAAVSRASSSERDEETEIIQSASGVRPLDFRDHIEVMHSVYSPNLVPCAEQPRTFLFVVCKPVVTGWPHPAAHYHQVAITQKEGVFGTLEGVHAVEPQRLDITLDQFVGILRFRIDAKQVP